MLHGLIEREEGLKAAALRAADAGDWQGVASMAKELQAVYRAILASGAVPAPESARWEGLLEPRRQFIEKNATYANIDA